MNEDHPLADWPTLAVLEEALARHQKELRAVRRMSDAQYAAFRTNFAIGAIDMPRDEAMHLLAQMIGTNLRMQDILRRTGR